MSPTLNILQIALLSCGILAPILFFTTDRLVGSLINGYNFSAHSMSDICSLGSPKRSMALWLTLVSSISMTAFGVGVWLVSGHSLLMRIASVFVIGNAILGLVANSFFPYLYGERPKFQSTHVIIMLFSVLFFVLAMVFGAIAISGWFRIFTIALPTVYVLLAIIRILTASKSSKEEANSLIGIQERTMSYSYLFWVFIFSIYLISIMKNG